ncbi:MAG: hypothetical protein AAF311_04910 [Pseudomonadota bacterium]
MLNRYGPVLLALLAIVLIGLSTLRWLNGDGLDWFSLTIAVAALVLLILQFRKGGSL